MSNVPRYADSRHQKLARLFDVTVSDGAPLERVFDEIVVKSGYRGLTKMRPKEKRSLVHHAATVPGGYQKEFFEKRTALRFRRSVPKIARRMDADLSRRAEIEALWSFYDAVPVEYRAVLGGLPASHFYKSPHWQRLRYLVLCAFPRKCAACGASGDVQIEVDHVRPRHLYPELAFRPDNLQLLCKSCHQGKGGRVASGHTHFSREVF